MEPIGRSIPTQFESTHWEGVQLAWFIKALVGNRVEYLSISAIQGQRGRVVSKSRWVANISKSKYNIFSLWEFCQNVLMEQWCKTVMLCPKRHPIPFIVNPIPFIVHCIENRLPFEMQRQWIFFFKCGGTKRKASWQTKVRNKDWEVFPLGNLLQNPSWLSLAFLHDRKDTWTGAQTLKTAPTQTYELWDFKCGESLAPWLWLKSLFMICLR